MALYMILQARFERRPDAFVLQGFGTKGAGSMNKFDCRKALAMRKSFGHQYGVGMIVDPKDNDA